MPTPRRLNEPAVPIPGVTIVRARFRMAARPVWLGLIGAAGLAASGQALARDHGLRKVGDWTVAPSTDGKGCFLTRKYERDGDTTLLLGLDTDGTNRLSVLNANWSIKPKERLKLNFRLSNSSYPAHFAIGIASDGKQGFVTSFGDKFPRYFAGSDTLDISRGDVPVARLGLDRGDAAVAQLTKCVAGQRGKSGAAADDGKPSDGIPDDPFASGSGQKSNG